MLFKIIGIGLCGAILSLMVKQHRPEFAIAIPLLTGAVILAICVPYISALLDMFGRIADTAGVRSAHLKIVIKIIGIAYICRFASDICKDAGEGSVSGKIELGGKLLIVTLSMPIIFDLLDIILRILNF